MATEERTGEPILKIRHLTKEFQLKSGLPFVKGPVLHAVTDVNLDLYEGETLGIIGESGCGKSTLGRTVTMLHKATSGTVEFEGRNIFELKVRSSRICARTSRWSSRTPSRLWTPV